MSSIFRFKNSVILLLFTIVILIATTISCSFLRVWYEQKMLLLGQYIRQTERESLALQRKTSILQAKIAQIHSPQLLGTMAARGGLVAPKRERLLQVAWEDVSSTERIARGRSKYPERIAAK